MANVEAEPAIAAAATTTAPSTRVQIYPQKSDCVSPYLRGALPIPAFIFPILAGNFV